jgi:hypothetical protein
MCSATAGKIGEIWASVRLTTGLKFDYSDGKKKK